MKPRFKSRGIKMILSLSTVLTIDAYGASNFPIGSTTEGSGSAIADGDYTTSYQSAPFNLPINKRGLEISVARSNWNTLIGSIMITAKVVDGVVDAFPSSYQLFIKVGSNWQPVAVDLNKVPDSNGMLFIDLGGFYKVRNIKLIPNGLTKGIGSDQYFFKIADLDGSPLRSKVARSAVLNSGNVQDLRGGLSVKMSTTGQLQLRKTTPQGTQSNLWTSSNPNTDCTTGCSVIIYRASSKYFIRKHGVEIGQGLLLQ